MPPKDTRMFYLLKLMREDLAIGLEGDFWIHYAEFRDLADRLRPAINDNTTSARAAPATNDDAAGGSRTDGGL